ncbi:ArgE/DapE family deacylase [Alteribacillus iranensis]|uniref:Acetylornithine deacetylase n=1 Tax=Alteribacillus iranensis TaxID=930128 RepID=A0A1I2B7E2_9BACI|nr:ArgE/DapE family deacylase [Alteribacillus iranensis]SFE52065.1 acetylornithine deacetylase [Alteribacillus iranensis]
MKTTVKNTQVTEDIFNQVDQLWDEEVEFLQEIGRYPTTLGNEQALQNYLAKHFEEMELDVDQFVPDMKELSSHPGFSVPEWGYDGRTVVVAKAPGADVKKGKSLIYQGHIDVVSPEPVSAWSYDPWGSTIKDGKMYGRGIQDMKSGVAAMIYAYKAVRAAGYRPAADFMLQTVIEEECTGNGALAALEKGYTADGALIPEPFGYKATKSQVGVMWMRVKVKGLGAHTERASEAVNAIEKLYVMMDALKKYRTHINEEPKHPDFAEHPHPLNVNIGTIQGGDWPSNVPSEATLEARVGFYPGQDPDEIKANVKEWLLEAAKEDEWLRECPPEITFYGFHAEGFALDDQSELFQVLDSAHETVLQTPPERSILTATTDARFFNLYYDIPCTCYGPTGGNMHGIDEWVDLESVKNVTKVYADFLVNWCGVVKEEK